MRTSNLEGNYIWRVTFHDEEFEEAINGAEDCSNLDDPNVWLVDQFLKGELTINTDFEKDCSDGDLLEEKFENFESLTKIDLVNKTKTEYRIKDLDLDLIKRLIEEY